LPPTATPTCTPIPIPTIEQRAEITLEEIQLAGGTLETYLRQEARDDQVMFLARIMWAEGKSGQTKPMRGTAETMEHVGWIVRIRVDAGIGGSSYADVAFFPGAFDSFKAEYLDRLQNPLGGNEGDLFLIAVGIAPTVLTQPIPDRFENLDSYSESETHGGCPDKVSGFNDEMHYFFDCYPIDNTRLWGNTG